MYVCVAVLMCVHVVCTCCVCIVVHGCLGVSVRVGTTLLRAASALTIVACTWPSWPFIMWAMATPPPKVA